MQDIISSHIDPNTVFIVQRSEIEERWDPMYYRPEIAQLEKKIRAMATKKLRDYIVRISSGATPSIKEEEKYYTDDKENGMPFLRVQNLQTNGKLNIEDVKYINKETHENYLRRSQVSGGDLLVKITGVGRMAIASVAPDDFIGNTNQHMVIIKTKDKETSEYLANYLNLDIIEKLASRRSTGGTRPALDYQALKSIPIIEGIDFTHIREAEKIKEQKENDAKALLETIDDYILRELGIIIPEKDNSLENRMFTVRFSEVSGERWDPEYYSLKYKLIMQALESSIYPKEPLRYVTDVLSSGKTPARNDYSEEKNNFPIIKVSSYKDDFIDLDKSGFTQKSQNPLAKKEDIFILSAAHQSEYVGRHIKYLNVIPEKSTSYVGELICVRVNKKCNSMFLFSLLNTPIYKDLLNREKTGQTSHVYGKDLKYINIPVPPIEKQNEISNHICMIRDKIKQLQQDANTVLEQAKRQIEEKMLKEAST